MALSANLVPSLNPAPPGIPMDIRVSVSLPTTLSSAYSSKGLCAEFCSEWLP